MDETSSIGVSALIGVPALRACLLADAVARAHAGDKAAHAHGNLAQEAVFWVAKDAAESAFVTRPNHFALGAPRSR